MSTFNPDQFLGTTTEEIGSTKYTQVPEGERLGQVTKVDAREINSEKTGQTYTILEVTWAFSDEESKRVTGQDSPTARQTLFVDRKPDGGLDFGINKNIQLSRLREAVGQARTGRAWAPSHLIGATAICLVSHGMDQNGDPRAEVKRVAPMGPRAAA